MQIDRLPVKEGSHATIQFQYLLWFFYDRFAAKAAKNTLRPNLVLQAMDSRSKLLKSAAEKDANHLWSRVTSQASDLR